MKALKYLGIAGGERSRMVLADVYNGTTDVRIKKSVLKSYMIAGDKARLLQLAKAEQNTELRGDAISQLGIIGARNELADLYANEQSVELRKKIIQAMFIGGNAEKLYDIARNEKNEELRLTAIRNLGLLGGSKTGTLLNQMYESDPSPAVRKAVINGLFLQGNAKALVALARKEKNREMKKEIVQKLSLINSQDATEFLVELLNE
jgi:HEAT repeat protein